MSVVKKVWSRKKMDELLTFLKDQA